jgi:hypothetical protein
MTEGGDLDSSQLSRLKDRLSPIYRHLDAINCQFNRLGLHIAH